MTATPETPAHVYKLHRFFLSFLCTNRIGCVLPTQSTCTCISIFLFTWLKKENYTWSYDTDVHTCIMQVVYIYQWCTSAVGVSASQPIIAQAWCHQYHTAMTFFLIHVFISHFWCWKVSYCHGNGSAMMFVYFTRFFLFYFIFFSLERESCRGRPEVCLNGAVCSIQTGGFFCRCTDGFLGVFCGTSK